MYVVGKAAYLSIDGIDVLKWGRIGTVVQKTTNDWSGQQNKKRIA